jgi:hypothetical protein
VSACYKHDACGLFFIDKQKVAHGNYLLVLVFFSLLCYIYYMTIEHTIEILPNHRLELDLPSELPLGMARVELVITPEKKEIPSNEKTAFGCLHRYADSVKIPGEKGAWERAVLEKYA